MPNAQSTPSQAEMMLREFADESKKIAEKGILEAYQLGRKHKEEELSSLIEKAKEEAYQKGLRDGAYGQRKYDKMEKERKEKERKLEEDRVRGQKELLAIRNQ